MAQGKQTNKQQGDKVTGTWPWNPTLTLNTILWWSRSSEKFLRVGQGLLEQWAGTREFHSNRNKVETTRTTRRSKDQLCLGLSKMSCLTEAGLNSSPLVLEKMTLCLSLSPGSLVCFEDIFIQSCRLEQNLKVILSEFPPQFAFFLLIIYHKWEKKNPIFYSLIQFNKLLFITI